MSFACLLLALQLVAAAPAAARSQSETPSWTVGSTTPTETEEVAFTSGGVRLRGTLLYPRGGRNLPVVIALHGASTPTRDHPIFNHLEQMLPPLGVALFVYDRRGTGASEGNDRRKTDFDLLAQDAVAAFDHLRRDDRFDEGRIGFWGLSQGGWMAMLAAAREPRASFALAISAPMAGADEQMNFAVSNAMSIKGYSRRDIDAALAARRAVDDYVRGRTDRAAAVKVEQHARLQTWWKDSYLAGNIDDPNWLGQMSASPLAALRKSNVRTLVAFGQMDPWVPVARSLQLLETVTAARPDVDVRVVDGADHAMMLGVPATTQIASDSFARLSPNAPAYIALVSSWLTKHVIAQS